MVELSLDVIIQKEGRWYVISDKKYGVTTQGRTVREAIFNFYEAFEMCYDDPDWRAIHHVNAPEMEQKIVEAVPRKVDAFVQTSTSFWQTVAPYILQRVQMFC